MGLFLSAHPLTFGSEFQMQEHNSWDECRILEAGCRVGVGLGDRGKAEQAEEGQVSGYWQGLSQRTRAAPVPPSGARPVGLPLVGDKWTQQAWKERESPPLPRCCLSRSLLKQMLALLAYLQEKETKDKGLVSLRFSGHCALCCAVLATSGTQL